MRTEQDIVNELEGAFAFLKDKVHVAREKRVFVDMLTQPELREVVEYMHDTLGFYRGHNLIGTDDGDSIGFLYLLSGKENIIVTLRTNTPKENAQLPSLTGLFPSLILFERELVDLFGVEVEGLPPGPNYPLPDDWPKGQWPMRKEWKPEYFNRQTMTYEPPAEKEAEQ